MFDGELTAHEVYFILIIGAIALAAFSRWVMQEPKKRESEPMSHACQFCGSVHVGVCERIKAIEYYPPMMLGQGPGPLKRVEFYDDRPDETGAGVPVVPIPPTLPANTTFGPPWWFYQAYTTSGTGNSSYFPSKK